MELMKFRCMQRVMKKLKQLKKKSQFALVNPLSSQWEFMLWQSCLDPICDDNGRWCCPPRDVPQGCLAVYVGKERKRFVIPAIYLKHSVFKLLLEKAKEEFGFSQKGGLTVPCEVLLFERFLDLVGNQDPNAYKLEMRALEKLYSENYSAIGTMMVD